LRDYFPTPVPTSTASLIPTSWLYEARPRPKSELKVGTLSVTQANTLATTPWKAQQQKVITDPERNFISKLDKTWAEFSTLHLDILYAIQYKRNYQAA